MIFPSNRVRILVATKPIDFRKGHDSLAAVVKNELRKDDVRRKFLDTAKELGVEICSLAMSAFYAQTYAEHPKAQLVAFHDTHPERSGAFADEYGGTACASLEELLSLEPALVSVSDDEIAELLGPAMQQVLVDGDAEPDSPAG